MFTETIDRFVPLWTQGSQAAVLRARSPGRVLFIQEDSSLTTLFEPCLAEAYEILRASTLAEAAEILRSVPVDLVLFECTPRQFEEALSTLSPACSAQGMQIPVVILSAFERSDFDDFIDDQPLTIVGHIQKTSMLKDLLDQLSEVLRVHFLGR